MCPAILPWRGMRVLFPMDLPHLEQNVADWLT